MRRTILRYAALCAVLCGGCQTIQHDTLSGRPEVSIHAAPDAVHAELVNDFINKGFLIRQDAPSFMIVEHPSTSFMENLLLGSEWNPQVTNRVSVTIVTAGETTRVVAALSAVTNPGTAFERTTEMSSSQMSIELQQFLNFVRDRLENPSQTPQVFVPPAPTHAEVARQSAAYPVGR